MTLILNECVICTLADLVGVQFHLKVMVHFVNGSYVINLSKRAIPHSLDNLQGELCSQHTGLD